MIIVPQTSPMVVPQQDRDLSLWIDGGGILPLVSHRDTHHPGLVNAGPQPRVVRAASTVALPEEQRAAAIERLLACSTRRDGLDWDLYSRVDREAWGHGASPE